MAGIIIYIPPIIPTPPINPTNEFVPVNHDGDEFIDSNIKNAVGSYLRSELGGNVVGFDFNFLLSKFCFGNPIGTNFCVDDFNGDIEINGVATSTPVVAPEKLMYIKINGIDYYLQLYKTI